MHKRGLWCRRAVAGWLVVCLSVRLSHSSRCPQTFSPSCSATILAFPHETFVEIANGSPFTEASNESIKIDIFDQCLALSRKRYKTEPQLQSNINRDLQVAILNGVTSNDLEWLSKFLETRSITRQLILLLFTIFSSSLIFVHHFMTNKVVYSATHRHFSNC